MFTRLDPLCWLRSCEYSHGTRLVLGFSLQNRESYAAASEQAQIAQHHHR
jgi:hypothetical protein